MAGICSAHQGYDKDCKACQVSVPMTAEDFLETHYQISHFYSDKEERMVCFADDVQQAMKEYAWIKVQEALKAASEKATTIDYDFIDEDSILNAYPKSNIV